MNPNNTDQNGPIPNDPYQPQTPPFTPPQAEIPQPTPVAPTEPLQAVPSPAPMQDGQQSAASPFFTNNPVEAPQSQQPTAPKKLSFPPKKYLFIGGGAIVVVVLIALLFKLIPSIGGSATVTSSNADLLESTAFYAKAKDSDRYALFDGKNEKKLTDYTFVSATSFINKLSVVENEAEEVGVINDTGKMVIDFGKYKDISAAGTLFEVEKDGEEQPLLINGNEKTVGIPKNAEKWIASNSASYATSPTFRPWQQYEARLHPVVDIKDGEEEITYVLNFNGKEIFSTTESVTQVNTRDSIYSLFDSKDKTYVVDSKAGKLVTEIDDKSASLIPAKGDTAVIPIGGSLSKPDKYVFIQGGSVKGELPGDTCDYIQFRTLPSDGSDVIFCNSAKRDHKLLNSDGTTIAEGSMFFTKDTYLSHENETISFHKGGSVVSTVKNCRSWVTLSGEVFTATAAYPIETTCDKSVKGVSYAVYDTDGKLIKAGGSEWDLGITQFTKDGLGIAEKKQTGYPRDDSAQMYVVNTSLEAQSERFTPGKTVSFEGTPYFVSTTNRNKGIYVAYSGDLKTKLFDSDARFIVEEEKFSTSEINDNTSLYAPIESIIMARKDGGDYAFFNPSTKTLSSATVTNDADIRLFKWYIVAEDKNDALTYYYRSGKLVE